MNKVVRMKHREGDRGFKKKGTILSYFGIAAKLPNCRSNGSQFSWWFLQTVVPKIKTRRSLKRIINNYRVKKNQKNL